jgi:hypothetical protein
MKEWRLTSEPVLDGNDFFGAKVDFVLIHGHALDKTMRGPKKMTSRVEDNELSSLVALSSATI